MRPEARELVTVDQSSLLVAPPEVERYPKPLPGVSLYLQGRLRVGCAEGRKTTEGVFYDRHSGD